MTFALASDATNDAALLQQLRAGDTAAAARLWVRHWPTALAVSRTVVETAEVPGLAAEALIGTLAMVVLGSGPDDDVAGFVTAAVLELGQDEEPPRASATAHPDVFTSVAMAQAFEQQSLPDRQLLWAALVDGSSDAAVADRRIPALEQLAETYCRKHAAWAESPECVDTHAFLGATATDGSALTADTWVHLSECAVCTEAFHELSHLEVATAALLGPAANPGPVAVAAASELFPAFVPAPVEAMAADVDADLDAHLPITAVDEDDVDPAAVTMVGAAAVLDEPEAEPEPEPAHRKRDHRTASRWRVPLVAALALLVVVGIGAVARGLTGADDDPAPTAGTAVTTTPDADPTDEPLVPLPTGSVDPTDLPTDGSTLGLPLGSSIPTALGTPTETAAEDATSDVDAPAPSDRPTKKPSPQPTSRPSSPPSAQPPAPTPTADPTKNCQFLPRLFGMCK